MKSSEMPSADREGHRESSGGGVHRARGVEPLSQGSAVEPAGPTKRIEGLDIARGIALMGMIIVHIMPWWSEETGISLFHQLFSGRSAALFALLAGISLALLTGGSTPHTGRRLRRDRVAIITRALMLLVFGMALNYLSPGADNILPYYGVYFLVGALLVGLSVRTLALLTTFLILLGPVLVHLGTWSETVESLPAATLTDLFVSPFETVFTLLFSGFYPVATWMAFVTCGLALGRLDLRELSVQIKLLFWGGLVGVSSAIFTELVMYHMGGFDRLIETTPWATEDILFSVEYGGGTAPGYSWWWLLIDAPHSNTSFWLLEAGGMAVFMVGLSLLASRVLARELSPIAAAGSMTFTLYTTHLVALNFNPWDLQVTMVLIHILAAIAFAYLWQKNIGQGPLETLISRSTKSVARAVVPGD